MGQQMSSCQKYFKPSIQVCDNIFSNLEVFWYMKISTSNIICQTKKQSFEKIRKFLVAIGF